jgi:hypothetical protein
MRSYAHGFFVKQYVLSNKKRINPYEADPIFSNLYWHPDFFKSYVGVLYRLQRL